MLNSGFIYHDHFHEVKDENSLKCSSYGNDSTKWQLTQGKISYTIDLIYIL